MFWLTELHPLFSWYLTLSPEFFILKNLCSEQHLSSWDDFYEKVDNIQNWGREKEEGTVTQQFLVCCTDLFIPLNMVTAISTNLSWGCRIPACQSLVLSQLILNFSDPFHIIEIDRHYSSVILKGNRSQKSWGSKISSQGIFFIFNNLVRETSG
jgi:hypothetical protein